MHDDIICDECGKHGGEGPYLEQPVHDGEGGTSMVFLCRPCHDHIDYVLKTYASGE